MWNIAHADVCDLLITSEYLVESIEQNTSQMCTIVLVTKKHTQAYRVSIETSLENGKSLFQALSGHVSPPKGMVVYSKEVEDIPVDAVKKRTRRTKEQMKADTENKEGGTQNFPERKTVSIRLPALDVKRVRRLRRK
jgi:hypothetical protein